MLDMVESGSTGSKKHTTTTQNKGNKNKGEKGMLNIGDHSDKPHRITEMTFEGQICYLFYLLVHEAFEFQL